MQQTAFVNRPSFMFFGSHDQTSDYGAKVFHHRSGKRLLMVQCTQQQTHIQASRSLQESGSQLVQVGWFRSGGSGRVLEVGWFRSAGSGRVVQVSWLRSGA